MAPTKLTVLISGNGSNLQAIIDSIRHKESLADCQIIRVLSNKKGVRGLQRAEEAGIPTAYHNLFKYGKEFPPTAEEAATTKYGKEARRNYDQDLAALILQDKPELVVCAGWMHILSPTFLEPMEQAVVPVINLHPALPGAFNGTHAIDRAYEAYQKGEIRHTGCMIHYVIQEVDMGRVIVTADVEIKPQDKLETLETRMHETEHKLIIKGTKMAVDELNRR